jgi:hypothetical protein
MKKNILMLLVFWMHGVVVGQEKELSKLIIGIGIGPNHLFKNVYDYSLTTDSEHKLKIDKLNRNSIVVSPVVVFRFAKIAKTEGSNEIRKFDKNRTLVDASSVSFYDKLSLILSTDLINVQSDKVSFNNNIDGGIGIGYSFNTNLMLGLFYEIKNYRQLRNYIVEQYENQSIPNGSESYNALDEKDNNLFYNKPIESISIKLIFNFNSL